MPSAAAILIFAQPVAADAARKHVASQLVANRRVVARLNQRTQLTAEATGLPVVRSTTLIDHIGTFGEQLTGAVQATFGLGYERVLIIGNDCPALTAAHLVQAAAQLATASVVLGPNLRGGVYLLGLSRAASDGVSLTRLPWQTGQLTQSICRLFSNQTVRLLPWLGDVNSLADLYQYRAITEEVALFIASLLAPEIGKSIHFDYAACPARVYCGTRSLRAPPAQHAPAIAA